MGTVRRRGDCPSPRRSAPMHVIAEKPLKAFARQHPDAAAALAVWFKMMEKGTFRSPADVRATWPQASFLPNDVVVFNVGHRARLSVSMRYQFGRVFVRRVMTHEEYNRRSRDGTL